jgi:hypothetical protein
MPLSFNTLYLNHEMVSQTSEGYSWKSVAECGICQASPVCVHLFIRSSAIINIKTDAPDKITAFGEAFSFR